ncbi:oogenesis-related protein sosie isoform X2 [Lycorma delicatula]|uniref:oogenesis-related protein sosie isoform X2 n=1 Tax=Lycorma delicatula TaxID=130591 RepID=UPI003F518C3F
MWNWCWGVVLASAVLGASAQENQIRAKRLTTFGKTAPVPSQPPSTAGIVVGAGKGTMVRECSTSEDCEEIQYTNCKIDPRDGRSRCLCMDNSPPVNGACAARPRALRSPCSQDSECIEGAECVINPNATVNINQKMCYCMPGWIEVDQLCSGSQSLSKSTATSIFIVSFIILLTFPSM